MCCLPRTREISVDFSPVPPTRRIEPEQVAPDTYLIHQLQPALGAPLSVYINSMVITGAEPVIVDTGTIANRKQWLDDAFSHRRTRGREVGLHLPRRHRPHRQPRRGHDARARTRRSSRAGRSSSGTRTRSTSRSHARVGSTTVTPSTSATACCAPSGRRSGTHRRRAACSTARPASTGRSTRSRRRCRPSRSRRSPSSNPPSGATVRSCSPTTRSHRGSGWSTRRSTPSTSTGSR